MEKNEQTLKERMEELRAQNDVTLDSDGYLLVMIDGKNFSTIIKNEYEKPFSEEFIGIMDETAKYVCENVDGCKFAYAQSDEITFVITSFDKKENCPFFGNRLLKICSIIPSLATAKFNSLRGEGKLCVFDAKPFTVDSFNDVYSFLLWRQNDCVRNSKQQTAQTYLSHRELNGKHTDEQIRMLSELNGVDWNGFPDHQKYGRFFYKVVQKFVREDGTEYMRGKWEVRPAFLLGGDGREKLKSLGSIPYRGEPERKNPRSEAFIFAACPKCGGELRWQNDYDCCDVSELAYSEGDGCIVTDYVCTRCGRGIEVFDPTVGEKDMYFSDYWNG